MTVSITIDIDSDELEKFFAESCPQYCLKNNGGLLTEYDLTRNNERGSIFQVWRSKKEMIRYFDTCYNGAHKAVADRLRTASEDVWRVINRKQLNYSTMIVAETIYDKHNKL